MADRPSLSRWKPEIIFAPGNPGIAHKFRCEPIKATEIYKLLDFVVKEDIAFTVVGPEDPLDAGIVNLFTTKNRRIFGPTAGAARIESNKEKPGHY